MDSTLVVLNILLVGGFGVTAYEAFKNFNPWAAVSMIISLSMLVYINGV